MSQLKKFILDALDEIKAVNITSLNIKNITTIADDMIIATGTSTTHVKAIANFLIKEMKKNSIKPIGIEGENDAEWILVDLRDIIVHIMLEPIREYYNLEKLWDPSFINKSLKQLETTK